MCTVPARGHGSVLSLEHQRGKNSQQPNLTQFFTGNYISGYGAHRMRHDMPLMQLLGVVQRRVLELMSEEDDVRCAHLVRFGTRGG